MRIRLASDDLRKMGARPLDDFGDWRWSVGTDGGRAPAKPIIDASNWASTPCDPNFYRSVDL
jgi:hypothetical protein